MFRILLISVLLISELISNVFDDIDIFIYEGFRLTQS